MTDEVRELEAGLPAEELKDEKGGLPPADDIVEDNGDTAKSQESVEDRLSRLQGEFEHERALKQAERRTRRTAQDNLTTTRRENEELKKRLDDLERSQEEDRRARIDADRSSRAAAAEVRLAEAHDAGDSKAIAARQRELTAIEMEAAREEPRQKKPEPATRAAEPAPVAEEPEPPETPAAYYTWAARNPWYNQAQNDDDLIDGRMAKSAMDLLLESGVDARTPQFFQALDNILAKKLPHRFQQKEAAPQRGSVARTAGAGRGNGTEDPGGEPKVPPETLEWARQAGRPVDDKAYVKRLASYIVKGAAG